VTTPTRAQQSEEQEFRLLGAERTPLRDFYHALLRLSWPSTLLFVAAGYVVSNVVFAGLYFWVGGIAHARPGSFRDAFYFSVQTMGTIGYGAMYPSTDAANALVAAQSTVGLVLVAFATGLVFARFSRPNARVLFSRSVAISPMNDVPTLSFRLGNRRSNRIVEAQVRVALVRREELKEGGTFYRMVDLPLERDRILSLRRAWTVLHVIDARSPLYRETPESLADMDAELLVTVHGIDDIWVQTVHASHQYAHGDLVWGARLADIISEDGTTLTVDLTKFHDLAPSRPIDGFPYPRS
jgi:inward rectifier potassium channel